MAVRRRIGVLATYGTALLAGPAFGQEIQQTVCAVHGGSADRFAIGPAPSQCSDPSLPPVFVMPLRMETATPAPTAAEPLTADLHLAATTLGFEEGVGPAPGRSVEYQGHEYRVVGIEVRGGGPVFSGGSAFVIGVSGSSLIVGLKAVEPGGLRDADRLDPSVVN